MNKVIDLFWSSKFYAMKTVQSNKTVEKLNVILKDSDSIIFKGDIGLFFQKLVIK